MSAALAGYAASAPDLIEPYEAIDVTRLYAPVADVAPRQGESVLDIGAGTGRDASYWTELGCEVCAVEPVSALWAHAEVSRLDDRLPYLARVLALGQTFDVITLTGVWHHLNQAERLRAHPVLANLLRPEGRILMHLRHGPTPANRPGYPINPSLEAQAALREGMSVLFQRPTRSMQPGNIAAGVRWTWLGLQKRF